MNIELAIKDITSENKRGKLLKAAYALSDQLGLGVKIDGVISKANPNHDALGRFASGHSGVSMASDALPVIEGVKALTNVNRNNWGTIQKQEFGKLREKIKDGLYCPALENRRIVGTIAKHLKRTRGLQRDVQDIIQRVTLMPYVVPIIEKGAFVNKREDTKGISYRISGKTANGEVSVILVEDKKSKLLYLSVFADQKMVGKAMPHAGDSTVSGYVGKNPVSLQGQGLAIPNRIVNKALLQEGGSFPLGAYGGTPSRYSRQGLESPNHISIIPEISAKSIENLPNIELFVKNITESNKKEKFAKAMRAVSEQLGIPVTVERRKERGHGGEPFFYRAQEDLIYRWYNFFSAAVDEAYRFVTACFGLPEVRILKKADGDLKHKGRVVYSPQTGQPIKQSEWDSFVKLLDKFLNRRLQAGGKRIILDAKALGRILGRMLKYNRLEAVTGAGLDDIKYRGKTFDWIADSVKNMRTVFGDELSRPEMARIQVLQQSAAQRITKVNDELKADIKQILIDGVKSRKGKSQISQDLFDRMTGHNRDFQKIADTEIQNALNSSYLLDTVNSAKPGEKVYFVRKEVIDANTCPFCKKMNGVVVLWSDHPLDDDKIKDPIAKYAIWDGKDWDGRKEFVANGVYHPYCRGIWMRYNAEVDALVAETQKRAAQWNEALSAARAEYKEKGIENPNDQTQGFTARVQELFDSRIEKSNLKGEGRGNWSVEGWCPGAEVSNPSRKVAPQYLNKAPSVSGIASIYNMAHLFDSFNEILEKSHKNSVLARVNEILSPWTGTKAVKKSFPEGRSYSDRVFEGGGE
jgi:hypothetical protein